MTEVFKLDYRALYSTETALLRVLTILLSAFIHEIPSVQSFRFDLISAFYTVKHDILFERLKNQCHGST